MADRVASFRTAILSDSAAQMLFASRDLEFSYADPQGYEGESNPPESTSPPRTWATTPSLPKPWP